jgi:hypothetical protein
LGTVGEHTSVLSFAGIGRGETRWLRGDQPAQTHIEMRYSWGTDDGDRCWRAPRDGIVVRASDVQDICGVIASTWLAAKRYSMIYRVGITFKVA